MSTHSYFAHFNDTNPEISSKIDLKKHEGHDCDENSDYSHTEMDWFIDEEIDTACLFFVQVKITKKYIVPSTSFISFEILSPPPKPLLF